MNHRVSKEGQLLGKCTAKLAEHGRSILKAKGLTNLNLPAVRDEMCATCACRAGTVPNGCLQTQMDFMKAVVQGDKFLCHSPLDGRICAGLIAVRVSHVQTPIPPAIQDVLKNWDYSPPD